LNKEFYRKISTPTYRFLVAGIIVLSSLYLGASFTPAPPNIAKVEVKNVSANISQVVELGFEISVDDEIIKLNSEEIKDWTEEYVRSYSGEKDTKLNSLKIYNYLTGIASRIEVQPINAKFNVIDGRVSIFQPSVTGKKVDIEESYNTITKAVRNGQTKSALVVKSVEPELTLERVNDLGINTLLGKGGSNFAGSSQARIYNIKLGANKFNGTMLKPGEQFSFNDILGDVDEKSGFQPELVIKSNKVVPEYGGGLCQVSTTLFRSVIYAGLPIIERKPHSFPVHYYNPQGFDSTIYPGVVDLKFVNNTPRNILIQSKVSGTKLVFEIYGSSDLRKVAIDGPYQYDQKPSGAMKAYFTRNISYSDGTSTKERFESVYTAPPPREKNPLE